MMFNPSPSTGMDICSHIEIKSHMNVKLKGAVSHTVTLDRFDDTWRIIIAHWWWRPSRRQHQQQRRINQTARRLITALAQLVALLLSHQQSQIRVYHQHQQVVNFFLLSFLLPIVQASTTSEVFKKHRRSSLQFIHPYSLYMSDVLGLNNDR